MNKKSVVEMKVFQKSVRLFCEKMNKKKGEPNRSPYEKFLIVKNYLFESSKSFFKRKFTFSILFP